MPSDEIINLDLDPREQRRRFWRSVVRIGVPVGAVLLIVVAIIAIAVFGYVSNRRDALVLSHDVLTALDKRIGQQLNSYLTPAVRVLDLLRGTLPDGVFAGQEQPLAENLALGVLRNLPQIANVTFADANGNFLMVKRQTSAAGSGEMAIKRIDNRDGARRVTWERRDAENRSLGVTEDPQDPYDPRTRPWFTGAVAAGNAVSWTDLYIFFTDQAPGITASRRLAGAADRPAEVVGVDISLDALSAFLASLEIGRSGRAMIVDAAGRLVAFPDPARMLKDEGGQPVPAPIDEIGEPLLTHAYDRLRILGPGWHVMTDSGTRYIIASSPLRRITGRDWDLLFVVPEDDFVGFVATNNRTSLVMSLAVVALAVALAILLARQGWRADQTARALAQRERALRAQSQAFTDLAASADLFDPADKTGLQQLTATVAETLRARRVSLWRLENHRALLICEDCYDRDTRGHTAGSELTEGECPGLFATLSSGSEIAVVDAALDPRTADLYRLYLQPAGCRQLMALPIRSHDRIEGSLWIEDLGAGFMTDADAASFAHSVASMLAPRYSARPRPAAAASTLAGLAGATALTTTDEATPPTGGRRDLIAPPETMRTASITGERSPRFRDHLAARGLVGDATSGTILTEAAVMVLRIVDPTAAARAAVGVGGGAGGGASGGAEASETTPLVHEIVCTMQRIAEAHEIDYLKILSDQIVAVDGFAGEAAQHARTVAEVALATRDFCTGAFAGLEHPADLAIGIDVGTVVGSTVGFGRFAFNIWGEAVRVAAAMAATAPPGSIQVTDRAYRHLASRYLFRNRGAFYVEREGEIATYVLKGRL